MHAPGSGNWWSCRCLMDQSESLLVVTAGLSKAAESRRKMENISFCFFQIVFYSFSSMPTNTLVHEKECDILLCVKIFLIT